MARALWSGTIAFGLVSVPVVAAAVQLVEQYAGSFEPGEFRDTYRERLCELVRAKERGETIEVAEREEPEAAPDLVTALRESVEAAKKRRGRGRRTRRKAA